MNSVILLGYFLPLIVLLIVMKLVVWVAAVNKEKTYVRNKPLRKRGPYMENPYEDVDEEDEEYGDRTDYR